MSERHDDRRSEREAMLDELTAFMRRHHRRRRRLGGAALVLVTAAAVWAVTGRAGTPGRAPAIGDLVLDPTPQETQGPVIVRTTHRTGLIRIMDDDELVHRLAEIDRPAGLIRAGERVWLTEDIADNRDNEKGRRGEGAKGRRGGWAASRPRWS